ncbi:sperm-associated antigen 17 [Engraulis encrasicolus]|uniref:sperm-associated antigen 17 n=1 Tax=Engraulis encrasicolus TaxID=184585 RepID=UPI002FCFAB3F
MPPKKQRSGTNAAIASPAVGPNKGWESGLSAATLEEEFWKINLSWVVVDSLEEVWYLSALSLAVQQPQRRQFSIISLETTLQKINELGNPKGKKVKDTPLFHEVLEAARSTLDAGQEISTDLMAKLVKFQLLCTKTADLMRITEMKGHEEKSKAKGASNSPTGPNGKPAKAEKGKKNAEPVAPVKETKLRRRGEEDDSHKYIDDEPEDGPQHYVLLVGFCQPTLLSALDAIGVHVSNVIRLRGKGTEDCDRITPTSLNTDVSAVLWMPNELDHFWTHLENVLLSAGNHSRLFDVVGLVCTIEENPCLDQESTEEMLTCGTKVFESVATLIYDCLDWRREHLHYLQSMKLTHVPSVTSGNVQCSPECSAEVQPSAILTTVPKKKQSEDSSDLQAEATSADSDLRVYDDLLKKIPPECTSVPLILHCMLEQISAEQAAPAEGSTSAEPDVPSDCNLSHHIFTAATYLPRPFEEKKRLMDNFGKTEDVKRRNQPVGPLLLNHRDKRAERLYHCPMLSTFDVSEIEGAMMKKTPVWKLLHSELSRHSKDMGFIMDTQECVRLLSEGLMNNDHSSEHVKSTLHSLTDLNVYEHFSAPVFTQVLEEASQTYQSMDTYRSPRDGALFILCHNPIGPQRDSRQSWDEALHTDVGFRNYLEHVAARLKDWSIQAGGGPEPCESPQTCAAVPITTEGKAEIYIQEESLKAFKIEQERLKKEEQENAAKKDKSGKAGGRGGNKADPGKDNKKSTKSPEQLQATSQPTPPHPPKDSEHQTTDEPAFAGYNMNGCLIHLISEKKFLYPADGGTVQVETNNFIHGMAQMTICVIKDMHHLYMNYSGTNSGLQLGSPKIAERKHLDHHGSFFAMLSTGMKLSSCHPCTGKKEPESTLPSSEVSSPSNQCSHTEGLLVCTPDGITVQFICQDIDGTKKLLVRQSSATLEPFNQDNKNTAELSRVITTEGTVIKYLQNGSSQTLFADGTVITYQDSDHILHSVPEPPTQENGSAKDEKVDNKESKEGKVKGNIEIDAENEVDEVTKSEPAPGQLCGSWTTTSPSGLQIHSVGETSDIQHILTYTSTDPFSQTVVTLREDGVISVQEPSGSTVVEHADGTRITTSHQETTGEDLLCSMKRWMVIQNTGFPTVLMGDDGSCQVLFGDGTVILASSDFSYQVMLSNSNLLSIDKEGQVMYTSQHRTATFQKLQPSCYVMSPLGDILCHVTDAFGNHFEVNSDGQTFVTESKSQDRLKTAHIPRLFVANGDGSGLELLSSEILDDLLAEAHADSTVAILKDIIPECPGAQEITLLKPSRVERCLDQMAKKDIRSSHLKCRNWDNFPSHEKKTAGSSFGTSLDRRDQPLPVSSSPFPMLNCPEVLLVRQLIQIPPDNSMQQHSQLVPRSLEDKHADYVMKYSGKLQRTEEECGDVRPIEFRSLDEQKDALGLLQLLLMDDAAVGKCSEVF